MFFLILYVHIYRNLETKYKVNNIQRYYSYFLSFKLQKEKEKEKSDNIITCNGIYKRYLTKLLLDRNFVIENNCFVTTLLESLLELYHIMVLLLRI